ncbi:uracil-DNA glycosylase [Collimonas sp.]|jgi:uracil-DNA glycosylase|uniref:uracil-DNA glycosylase n=1 Tax=Collimonas sp. TaxID=1963772 RepID=UPI002CB85670|nr:uracil-DNA glycosylase [Collimonas sp.]HWW08543.1 uracil-DNA glycosylase [Collimonas sp.]
MTDFLPASIRAALDGVHASWLTIVEDGLRAVAQANPAYLRDLAAADYLPTDGRMFAAFTQPLDAVRYVLVGEGPYPRAASATGVCFMDGAVGSLWSEKGLSKQVNRATSLRNFMKMLLVADGQLALENTTGDAMSEVAQRAQLESSPAIQLLADLQANMVGQGFLLLNASLVFRADVPPVKDAKAWQPFMQAVLQGLADAADKRDASLPTLVLWGKIAEQLNAYPVTARFPKAVAEHPYNLSFIGNAGMQALFGPMQLLRRVN